MKKESLNDKITKYPILNEVRSSIHLKNLSDNSVKNYMNGIARFLEYIDYDNVSDITEDQFRDYLFYLHSTDMDKNTINANNSYIRFFFQGVLNKPINSYRVPRCKSTPKDIDFLFDHQIRSLLDTVHSDSRMDCIIKLALWWGLRINEIISLKVCGISTKDKNNMTVYIRESKRNRSRHVPLDNTVYRAIQHYAKEYHIKPGSDQYFFVFRHDSKPSIETVRRHFIHYRDLAHIPDSFTFHCLRHTYAVNFLRAGGELYDLKYRLGHSSLMSTSRYLHFSKNMMNHNISYIDSLMKDGDRSGN